MIVRMQLSPGFLVSLLAMLCIWGTPQTATAQSNIEVFGENRVQKRKFVWKYFDTKHFRVYHYDRQGRELGRYVAEEAEYDMKVVEKKLASQFPRRFNIILYNNYDEYRQSNIGLKDESPTTLGNTKAGSLKIVDDKLVVYFTGAHADIRRQIRSGMALVVMQRMLYGDNLKKAMKNSLLLNLPQWVTEGYIAYMVDGWDEKSNSEWKGVLDANEKKGFYELAEMHPELAGKAFWKFVSDQYGTNTMKTLLYAMQQKTSLNKAMKEPRNLNMKVTVAYDSCISFYKAVYRIDEQHQEMADSTGGIMTLKIPKDGSVVRNIKVSPDGRNVAYVVWKNGQYTVCLQKAGNKNVVEMVSGGQKDLTEQIDPSYPMLAWSKNGSKLAIMYLYKGNELLRVYNNMRGRTEIHKIRKNRFDRVLSMTFTEDDGKMIFSAIKKSQTDLYEFTIRGSKTENITDDVWDDLSPEYVSGGSRTGVLFLSNRPKPNLNVPQEVNELPAGPQNVFFYNTVAGQPTLTQCTHVSRGRISQPVQYGTNNFAYLHDSNGINNKFVVMFGRNADNKDSAYSVPVTNYTTGIRSHQYCSVTGSAADVLQRRNKYVVFFHDLVMPSDTMQGKELRPTILSGDLLQDAQEPPVARAEADTTIAKPEENKLPLRRWQDEDPIDETPEIKGGTAFQTEFSDTEPEPQAKKPDVFTNDEGMTSHEPEHDDADSSVLNEISDSAYLKMKPARYRYSFKPDFLSIKLDNSILFNQYQSIDANGGKFANPSLGALTNISLNEIMENQRITLGFQLPINVSYSTYFLQYQNFTHRVDWGGMFMRRQNKDYMMVNYFTANGQYVTSRPQLFQMTSNITQADFGYAIDRVRSLRFHTGVRQDRFIQKLTDSISLIADFPARDVYTSFSRLEYVFDNTITPTMNILNGTRYKVYTEYMYGLNAGNKSCYNIGVDVRNYQKIYKNFIVANRLAYAHSDGNKMVQYLLGGVDNWISPQTAANGNYSPGENFGFQMLATSLRGYKQSARVGNNFAVLSTEFRLPAVTTFVKRPIQSAMLKNLQAVAFIDAGTAWKGFLPDADALSPSQTYYLYGGLQNTIMVVTTPYGASLGVGYGGGLRTSLFGYFLRFDVAWNVEGDKPIAYLALGTDF